MNKYYKVKVCVKCIQYLSDKRRRFPFHFLFHFTFRVLATPEDSGRYRNASSQNNQFTSRYRNSG